MSEKMSIREAAQLLSVSDQAVHKRIRSGSLSAEKLNGRWFVDAASVQAALGRPPRRGRPLSSETYMLMNGPYEAMEFSYRESDGSFAPGKVRDALRAPLGTVTRNGRGRADGLRQWWDHRSIPESRSGMDEKLRRLGLDDPSQIPFRNLGLSLSDQYWVCPVSQEVNWEDVNYFRNPFGDSRQGWDEWLGEVGLSSPDNTSEGVLPKRWLCEGPLRILLKGHVPWTDQQVFNERVATLLHGRLLREGEYVSYEVVNLGKLGVASSCSCFVGEREEYVPFNLVAESEGKRPGETAYDNVVRLCRQLGIAEKETERFLSKMIVCDGIMANTDRHLRNFGLIRDIDNLSWRFAPLFDTGNSLWYDKDEGEVARGDYSYASRPFDARPNRQLMYASTLDWLDLSSLDGFPDEACEVLEEGNLSRWRLEYLREGIERRIAAVAELCG